MSTSGRAAGADPGNGRARVVIEHPTPSVDDGRFAAKLSVGERCLVEADVFGDGHDHVGAVLAYRRAGAAAWSEVTMEPIGSDRFAASFEPDALGRWEYTVSGYVDHYDTWRSDLAKRVEAGQDVAVDLKGGSRLVAAAAGRASAAEKAALTALSKTLEAAGADAAELVLDPHGPGVLPLRYPDRTDETTLPAPLPVDVDRERARFSAWYEFFPRSTIAGEPARKAGQGTLRSAIDRLPYVASLGFDVLYLPPIHPIGVPHRKGRNNAEAAEAGDTGSPWAIGGGPDGGHLAVDPLLGTLADVDALAAAATGHGLELALDIAFQCAPDHPWVTEHPTWFKARADGTIQYAENPPKRYQDIYPLDFESEDWHDLWVALRDVFVFWIGHGIRIFRVDNPHTKAFPFWEWCMDEIRTSHPDTIFLAEAFTRPRVMERLAKLGFNQSYTYFTWRYSKHDFVSYLTELTSRPLIDYFRPNFWPNTPDILTSQLQGGSRGVFVQRLVLAATLSANWGMYGPAFELMDHQAAVPGKEEYLDSEKYQLREWDLARPDSLAPVIAIVNEARRAHPALQTNRTLRFHGTSSDLLLAYSKTPPPGVEGDAILVVANLDGWNGQNGWVQLDLEALGLVEGEPFELHDLIGGGHYTWWGSSNYVELDAWSLPAHVFRIARPDRERTFDGF